ISPRAFVPKIGTVSILDVQPGDTTLISGQPLEVTTGIDGKAVTSAELIIDRQAQTNLAMSLLSAPDASAARFARRIEHVDDPISYRIEAGGTQSRWFAVRVVKQVALQRLDLRITPPAYARRPPGMLSVSPENPGKNPITVLQGSTVVIDAGIDIPADGAMV